MKQDPKELIEELEGSLPPVFGEKSVEELIPGFVSHRTLKNLRCEGKGPKAFRAGRRILYRRSDFLSWLEARLEQPEKRHKRNTTK